QLCPDTPGSARAQIVSRATPRLGPSRESTFTVLVGQIGGAMIVQQTRRQVMKLTELFRAELDREAPRTRGALEQVPQDRDDWKPHPKSMTPARLAGPHACDSL